MLECFTRMRTFFTFPFLRVINLFFVGESSTSLFHLQPYIINCRILWKWVWGQPDKDSWKAVEDKTEEVSFGDPKVNNGYGSGYDSTFRGYGGYGRFCGENECHGYEKKNVFFMVLVFPYQNQRDPP